MAKKKRMSAKSGKQGASISEVSRLERLAVARRKLEDFQRLGYKEYFARLAAAQARQPIRKAPRAAPALEELMDMAVTRGHQRVRARDILKAAKRSRFGTESRRTIEAMLTRKGLAASPAVAEWKSGDSINLYKARGDLFAREDALEDFVIKSKAYRDLGIVKDPVTQVRPDTGARIDIQGQNNKGDIIVIELKRAEGGRGAVHQVFEYMGYLKRRYPRRQVRGILVTGVRDWATVHVLRGMPPISPELFDWYLYNYDKKKGKISFEPVRMKS